MNDYCSLVTLTAPLDQEGVLQLARLACLELYKVYWLRGYLSPDGKRLLCWYRARDAETIRLILRQQETPDAPVWPVALIGDESSEVIKPIIPDRQLFAVVLDVDGESDSTQSEIMVGLEKAGLKIYRGFISTAGNSNICLVEGQDEATLRAGLDRAGVTVTDLWPCAEMDPIPPQLFQSDDIASHRDTDETLAQNQPNMHRSANEPDFDALIIGAGVSGICALERLLRMGLRVRLFESADDVGGVWQWNRYPGARVDSETYTYGYSFSDELIEEWDWQELFSPQPEILRYLQYVTDRFDLRRYMQFSSPIARAVYQNDPNDKDQWLIETEAGEQVSGSYLIAATGTLSVPQWPDVPGIDDFLGESHHTGRWPTAGVDLKSKRVGVVGTGATGIQVIQTIADQVDQLTVFQRTPNYAIPQRNRSLTNQDREQIRRDWAETLAFCKKSSNGFIHEFQKQAGLAVTPAERVAKFEELWEKPGFAFWLSNFGDLLMNTEVNEHACEFVRGKIRQRVKDQEIAEKLLPYHPFGTKRIPLENGYFEVYNQPNVELVDLNQTPIEQVTPVGIQTGEGEYELDVIIYATGFDAGTGPLTRINIQGSDGVTIEEKWRSGPSTFLGLLVEGFPNLFIINGPQNAAGLCNAGRCIEQNVDWIERCLIYLRNKGLTKIVPTEAAEQEWSDHIDNIAKASVLWKNQESWFFGANTPGKARKLNVYPAGAREYRSQCEAVEQSGYPGVNFS